MKKLFGWIILTAILVAAIGSMTCVTAFAEKQNDVVLTTRSTVKGDELTVFVRVDENDGINILTLRLEYDQESLELVGRTFGTALASLDPYDNFEDEETPYTYPYRAIYAGRLVNDTTTGSLVTFRFRVKEGAVGENKVSVVVREVGYMKEGKTDAPVYNTRYGEAVDLDAPGALLLGGVEVTAATYEISEKGEITVPDQEAPDKGNRSYALPITLALVGAVLVIGGIILAAYLLRKK